MKRTKFGIGLYCVGLIAGCHRSPQAIPTGNALARAAAPGKGGATLAAPTGSDVGMATPLTAGSSIDPTQQAPLVGTPAIRGDHLAPTIQR